MSFLLQHALEAPMFVQNDDLFDKLRAYINTKQFVEKTDMNDKNFGICHAIPVLLRPDGSSKRYCDTQLYIPDDESKWFGRVSHIAVSHSVERRFDVMVAVTNPEYQNDVLVDSLNQHVKAYPWIAINPWTDDNSVVLLSVILELMGRGPSL